MGGVGACANSADPGQTPLNATSDLGLHCLFTEVSRYSGAPVAQRIKRWPSDLLAVPSSSPA